MDGIAEFLTQGTELTIWIFVALCGVSFLGSFIAAALGLGGGLLVLATMAMVLPPAVLIPVHGVVQLGSNFGRAMLLARQVLYTVLPAFLAGTVIGAAVGAHVVVSLPKWLLLGVLGSFVLYSTWAPGFRSSKPGPAKFFALGAVSTFISMFVGGTGPLIAPFAAAAGTQRQQVVATHAMLMSIQHGFKVLAFGLIGFAFGSYVPLLIGLLAFGFLGTYCGRAVLDRLPEEVFRNGLKTILTLLAFKLFYDSAQSFIG